MELTASRSTRSPTPDPAVRHNTVDIAKILHIANTEWKREKLTQRQRGEREREGRKSDRESG